MHNQKNRVKTIHKKKSSKRDKTWPIFLQNPCWIEEVIFFNSKDITHFQEKIFITKRLRSYELLKNIFLLFSFLLMIAQNLAHFEVKMLFLRCIENPLLISWCIDMNKGWLFIEKTIIIACNQLNLQGNRLI